jgi:hypothetical protein
MDIGGALGFKKEKSKSSGSSETVQAGTKTERLNLDQNAIEKIIADVLGSESGLASIFAGEQQAGIFDSSVAAQASGDLVANLIGELAKITGERVVTTDATESVKTKGKTKGSSFAADLTAKLS